MTVEDKDRGWKRIKRELSIFNELEIFVGFQGEDGEVAEIAAFNEFGTETIPARPFLRLAIDTNKSQIGKAFDEAFNSIVDRKATAIQAANRLGLFGVSIVKKQITTSTTWAEPNAPATIDRKGSSTPLVDTAQMLNSVTYVVRHKGSVVASG